MAWTKRQLVLQAFEELGLGASAFDMQPEELQSAAVRMDSMVASWLPNVAIPYPITANPSNVDLNTLVNLPEFAYPAVWLNLALWVAPTVGKTPSLETKNRAYSALNSLKMAFITPPPRKIGWGLPTGAGNKPWCGGGEYIEQSEGINRSKNGDEIDFT